MSKTITLRLDDEAYRLLRMCAEADNRPLSNFIETAAKRYIEENGLVDIYEMKSIVDNKPLHQSIQRGHRDAKAGRGRFV